MRDDDFHAEEDEVNFWTLIQLTFGVGLCLGFIAGLALGWYFWK